MSLEPNRFTNTVEETGLKISVGLRRRFIPDYQAGDEAFRERVELAALVQIALLAEYAAHPALSVSVDDIGVAIHLDYEPAERDAFVDEDVTHIIAACEIAIDESIGRDPATDKSVE